MRLIEKINIVVVNYNNSQCSIDMINTLIASEDYLNEIVIVDNKSNSAEVLKLKVLDVEKLNFKVSIIFLDENVGYFPGLNVGIETLTEVDKIPTFIGNNDILFNDEFFSTFFKIDFPKKVFAVAPSLITSDNVYQNPAQVTKPRFFKRFFYNVYFSNYFLGTCLHAVWQGVGLSAQSKFVKDIESKPIYIGMGAAYILMPSFFENNSKLVYPFFLYGEEAFLSKQIEDGNGILWYQSDMELVHLESVATSKMPSRRKYELMKKAHLIYKNYFK